jgi:hypothetical protein
MRYALTFMLLSGFLACAMPAFAQQPSKVPTLSGDVDLILPPTLASSDAPFYRGASVKVGNTIIPVKEAATTNGQLAEFQADKNQVVISNAANASESDKGQALLNVVTAMQASAIATAAGQ